jgi:hypothetical protein
MAYYTNYIGYKSINKRVGVAPGAVTAATGGAAFPITAVIDVVIGLLPVLIPWIGNAFKHPARDANKLIDGIKKEMQSSDARKRLALVLAIAGRIAPAARDVAAEKLFLWYKNTYPEDYKALTIEDMQFYNDYLITAIRTQADGNNFWYNSKRAMFTASELNYNASVLEKASSSASNILSNLTQSPSKLILYGGIGLGLYLILKKQ